MVRGLAERAERRGGGERKGVREVRGRRDLARTFSPSFIINFAAFDYLETAIATMPA